MRTIVILLLLCGVAHAQENRNELSKLLFDPSSVKWRPDVPASDSAHQITKEPVKVKAFTFVHPVDKSE